MYNVYPSQTNGKGIAMNRSELTAAFRNIGIAPGTELEVHGSLSSFGQVDGWGKHAAEAARGGFDHVLHSGGKGLLLGVDIYKLTAMHYVEYLIPEDIRRLNAPTDEINSIYPPEEWFIEVGRMPVMCWYGIQQTALDSGAIKRFTIGACPVMFFDLWEVVGLYEQALRSDPYSLFGLEKGNLRIK